MNGRKYSITQSCDPVDGVGEVIQYGIQVDDGITPTRVDDISSDKSFVEGILSLLSVNDCSALHLVEVVCDII